MDSKTTGQQTTGQQEKAEVVSGLVVSGRNQPDLEGANCLGHWELSEPLFLGAQFPIGETETRGRGDTGKQQKGGERMVALNSPSYPLPFALCFCGRDGGS